MSDNNNQTLKEWQEWLATLTPEQVPGRIKTGYDQGQPLYAAIVDKALYLQAIRADVAAGPNGPRHLTGALLSELQRLKEAVDSKPKKKGLF